jgi:hypothetical protein
VNLISKSFCQIGLAFLVNRFACGLHVFAGLAKETWLVVDKLNPSDHVIANDASDSVKGDVAKTPMECDDIDNFWHGCCSINSLSFV